MFSKKKARALLRHPLTVRLLVWYLKFVYKTTRWTFYNQDILEPLEGKPRLFCFWHGRLSMMPFAWESSESFYMLLSKHGDGQFIGDILQRLGASFELIHGSTNRNGAQAAIGVIHHLKAGHPVGITPDGPRGPRETVSEGTAVLAYLSQAVTIPATFFIKNSFCLKSWDRFCVPLPFSTGHYVVGDPIAPPAGREEFEEWRNTLRTSLNALKNILIKF